MEKPIGNDSFFNIKRRGINNEKSSFGVVRFLGSGDKRESINTIEEGMEEVILNIFITSIDSGLEIGIRNTIKKSNFEIEIGKRNSLIDKT
jgi:hypothetical protein